MADLPRFPTADEQLPECSEDHFRCLARPAHLFGSAFAAEPQNSERIGGSNYSFTDGPSKTWDYTLS
jgi:hypothetical protein